MGKNMSIKCRIYWTITIICPWIIRKLNKYKNKCLAKRLEDLSWTMSHNEGGITWMNVEHQL
jgi:hypothetical protein